MLQYGHSTESILPVVIDQEIYDLYLDRLKWWLIYSYETNRGFEFD